ncbi:MAG: DUF423 domain-containing protein [Thiolinea sp.]
MNENQGTNGKNQEKNYFLLSGALFAMLAVMLGAFGAHGLEKILPEQMLQRYHTGVEYQFYHAFALLCVGLLRQHLHNKLLIASGISFIAGILLFSGSLYLYALSGNKLFGMITPLGGLSFTIGWVCLIKAAWQLAPRKH